MKVTDAQVYHAWRSSLAAAPDAFISWWGIRAALESLDVQVVGPGPAETDARYADLKGDPDFPSTRTVRMSAAEGLTVTETIVPPEPDPAAEPDRVTLPDTPYLTIRVQNAEGEREEWHTDGDGLWRHSDNRLVVNDFFADVVDYTILAQPPKADAAETDAPAPITDWRAYVDGKVGVAIDIARDEALAVVVKALQLIRNDEFEPQEWGDPVEARHLTFLADAISNRIEREQGGDGHE